MIQRSHLFLGGSHHTERMTVDHPEEAIDLIRKGSGPTFRDVGVHFEMERYVRVPVKFEDAGDVVYVYVKYDEIDMVMALLALYVAHGHGAPGRGTG